MQENGTVVLQIGPRPLQPAQRLPWRQGLTARCGVNWPGLRLSACGPLLGLVAEAIQHLLDLQAEMLQALAIQVGWHVQLRREDTSGPAEWPRDGKAVPTPTRHGRS